MMPFCCCFNQQAHLFSPLKQNKQLSLWVISTNRGQQQHKFWSFFVLAHESKNQQNLADKISKHVFFHTLLLLKNTNKINQGCVQTNRFRNRKCKGQGKIAGFFCGSQSRARVIGLARTFSSLGVIGRLHSQCTFGTLISDCAAKGLCFFSIQNFFEIFSQSHFSPTLNPVAQRFLESSKQPGSQTEAQQWERT